MAQQIDTRAVDPKAHGTVYEDVRKLLAELMAGIRVDVVPRNDSERLAQEGGFYPLTVDRDGFLRVTLPETVRVETGELIVLREIRDLLIEQRDLLLKIA